MRHHRQVLLWYLPLCSLLPFLTLSLSNTEAYGATRPEITISQDRVVPSTINSSITSSEIPLYRSTITAESPHPSVSNILTDDQFVHLAKEADKQLAIALFVQNPQWLHENGLKPVTIKSKDDLIKLLSPYWTEGMIEDIWRSGSELMPNLPWGFYSEGPPMLFLAKDVQVTEHHPSQSNPTTITISGIVPNYFGDEAKVQLRLVLTDKGWRAEY
ncbi:hypothetical protein H1S01_09105 [Heliobacterium chlorum]|uniref:Uncharacterized protein n=1 Tax=Heliobacterium chlorum TaxID=2698 RepID=A0ABR7T1K7_HELCL|nr:hypothetical protein [Heliobacterium chlorum]MBC9784667.1 hypothetical protein [Heliobacterium chlorum]